MSRTENRTENRTSRPVAEPELVPNCSLKLRRRKPGRTLSERNVYHQRRSLLPEYQSGGTARRHAQFGNGQRASRASAGGRQDGRYPSLGLQSGCEAWHQGGTFREYTLENATVLYELDEHGRVYVLPSASSNLHNLAHSSWRIPQDSALIEDLRRHWSPGFRVSSESPEDTKQVPERPEEPSDLPRHPPSPLM
jgi:hypothetical protein